MKARLSLVATLISVLLFIAGAGLAQAQAAVPPDRVLSWTEDWSVGTWPYGSGSYRQVDIVLYSGHLTIQVSKQLNWSDWIHDTAGSSWVPTYPDYSQRLAGSESISVHAYWNGSGFQGTITVDGYDYQERQCGASSGNYQISSQTWHWGGSGDVTIPPMPQSGAWLVDSGEWPGPVVGDYQSVGCGNGHFEFDALKTWQCELWLPEVVLEAVDPLQGTPPMDLVTQQRGLSPDDPERLASGGRPVLGVAADGATRILLRARLPGPGHVTFSLYDPAASSGPVEPGTLTDIAGSKSGAGVAIEADAVSATGGHYAFALYQAPDGCPGMDKNGLPFSIWAIFTDEQGATSQLGPLALSLYQPPVVLLHGINSSGLTWEKFPLNANGKFRWVEKPSYHDDSGFSYNSERVPIYINQALGRAHADGVAACQAERHRP